MQSQAGLRGEKKKIQGENLLVQVAEQLQI